ncbi:GIY-YIG nuclease family protein [Xenophilus aerolatus]
MYTIPLCAWFDDHIAAEASYHRMFSAKRINGEWFSLEEQDVALVRARQYQA